MLYDGEVRGPGTGDRISDHLDETVSALTTWARTLADARPYLNRLLDRLGTARQAETIDEAKMVAWLCAGFSRYLTSAATLDWCGEFVRDLAQHEALLRGLTEAAVPGWYAGKCRQCKVGVYVVPGLTWVTCATCGTTTYAGDHLEVILEEAAGWVAAPTPMAGAIVALVDTEISVFRLRKRITKWGDRERITVIQNLNEDGLPRGLRRYRMGEVLNVLLNEGATRLTEVDSPKKAIAS